MSCVIQGYSLGCSKDGIGGATEVYAAVFTGTTFTYDSNDVITGGTMNDFYTFEQSAEQIEFVQNGVHNTENRSNFYEQNVSMILPYMDADLRNTIKLLNASRVHVIVKDNNGKYWLVGENAGADVTASTIGAGKAYGDLNGANITVMAKERYPARELSETYFNTLTVL